MLCDPIHQLMDIWAVSKYSEIIDSAAVNISHTGFVWMYVFTSGMCGQLGRAVKSLN
jgi:hypothetical protein